MNWKSTTQRFKARAAPFALAFLLLFVGVASKIPTSHCHCHDAKSSSQQKVDCPFGQLRALSSTTLGVEPVLVQAPSLELFEPSLVVASGLMSLCLVMAFDAQAPPAEVVY